MLAQKGLFHASFESGIEQNTCYWVMILLIDLWDISMMKCIDIINQIFSQMYDKYIRTETYFFLPLSL